MLKRFLSWFRRNKSTDYRDYPGKKPSERAARTVLGGIHIVVDDDIRIHAAVKDFFADELEYLDSGAFARVYGREGLDHVIKIFTGRDHAYLNFASELIHEPTNNPRFPKVEVVGSMTYHIHSAKYKELEKNNFLGVRHFSEIDRIVVRIEALTCVANSKRTGEFVGRVNRVLKDLENGDTRSLMRLRPVNREAVQRLRDLQTRHKHWIDLHCGNVMKRGHRFVFTDPVV